MPLHYYLLPNVLGTAPGSLAPRVLSNRVLHLNKIFEKMDRRGSTVTIPDMQAVVTLLFEVIADEVAEGNTVNLPLMNIRPALSGRFDHMTEKFDHKKHRVKATISAGLLLKQKLQAAELVKVSKPERSPQLTSYLDINTDTSNRNLTPGGIGSLSGTYLNFDPDNEEEGIFFIAQSGEEIRASFLSTRHPSTLTFIIPRLETGTYMVEVRKLFGKKSPALRTGMLKYPLVVE
jgi:hypothetical protein